MELVYYSLAEYKDQLDSAGLLVESEYFKEENRTVNYLEYNSKEVKEGTLFVCKGAHFKEEYLHEAIERGTFAYIAEEKYELSEEIPYLIVSDIRKAMAVLAELYYNSPQEKLKIIGIGGTKGKTTTAYYIKNILDRYLKAQGKKPAGILSSIHTFDGYSEVDSVNTTPISMDLNKYFARMIEAGLEYVVMEVSSQALKYHRTDGIEFDVGIFLNIDEDHISPIEHPNFEDYIQSKAKMFGQTKSLIVNRETQEASYIFKRAQEAEAYYTFSLVSDTADYFVDHIETSGLDSHFSVQRKNKEAEEFVLSMPGIFNIENAVSAIAALDLLKIPLQYAHEAFKEISVPGRMETLMTEDKKIIAVADFAHNRLSFESLVTSMRTSYPDYKVVAIFGAPGGKSLGRRKELGQVGGKYLDEAYITTDDPAFEDVVEISEEIAKYVAQEGTPYQIIEDRPTAIKTAFEEAKEKTVILAIGKGHEKTMIIKDEKVPIQSDESLMRECVEEYNQKNN